MAHRMLLSKRTNDRIQCFCHHFIHLVKQKISKYPLYEFWMNNNVIVKIIELT